MYRCLSVVFLLLLLNVMLRAQLKIEFMSQDAGCFNNGSVLIIATGGTEPYNYEIVGNTCGLSNRSLTANPLFVNLPGCTYTFLVIDATGQKSTHDITVNGNYNGPNASVTVDGCGFEVITKSGSPPIKYYLSTDGGRNYGPPSSQHTYTGLSDGTYFIKIEDSCNSTFVTSATITLDPLEYEFERVYRSFLTDSISPGTISGGQGPFQFMIINGADTLRSAYNTFAMKDIVKTCSTQVVIQSACGRYVRPFKYVDAELICLDFSHGRAELKVNVGVGPFTSFYYSSSSPALSFPGLELSGLPQNSLLYSFALRDQCGDFATGAYETLYRYLDGLSFKTSKSCGPLDSLRLDFTQNNYYFKNLYTVECTSCLPVQQYTGIEKSVTIKNLNAGNKTFKISDNCGTDWSCKSEYFIPVYEHCDSIRLSLINSFSCNNKAGAQTYSGDTIPVEMYFLRTAAGLLLDSNSLGIFHGLDNGKYIVEAKAPGCGIISNAYSRNMVIAAPAYRIGLTRANEGCKTEYFLNVDYTYFPYTLTDTAGGQVIATVGSNTQFGVNFDKIKPGKYILKSLLTCWQQEIKFPEISPKLKQENISICPAGGSITVSGGKSYNQWEEIYKSLGLDLTYINHTADWYSIGNRESTFNYDTATHTYFNIEPGKPYTIYLHSFASVNYTNQLNRCPVDSITFITPDYHPPALISDLTLKCDQANTGLIQLRIKNGTGPYRIQESDCSNQSNIDFSLFTSDSAVTIDNLDPNVHCFKVTDACQNSSIVEASPSNQLTSIQTIKNCDSTSTFYFSSIPGAVYSWTNKLNVRLSDSFKLILPDPPIGEMIKMHLKYKGCEVNQSLLIDSQSLKKFSVAIIGNKNFDLCAGDSIQLTPVLEGSIQPISYTWNDGSTNPTNWIKKSGIHTLKVRNGIGCMDSTQVNIRIGEALRSDTRIKTINCFGDSTGSIKMLPSGGLVPYVFAWNTGSVLDSISGLKAGNYLFTVTDIAGCKLIQTVELKQNEKLAVAATPKTATCPVSLDGSIQLTASGGSPGYSYLWNTGQSTNPLNRINPGNYAVTVTDQLLCKTSLNVAVLAGPLIQSQRNDTICAGTVLRVGSSVYTISGNYRDTFKTIQGCDSLVMTRLTVNAPLDFTMTAQSPICNGQSNGIITISNFQSRPPYTYTLNGKTISGFKADQLGPGNYIVKLTDGYGCFSERGASLSNPRKIDFDAGKDTILNFGDSILLKAFTNLSSNEVKSIKWTSDQGYFCSHCESTLLKPRKDQTFIVELENNSGCKVQDQFTIHLNAEFLIFAPNIIRINTGGSQTINDRFTIFSDLQAAQIEYLRIFDRSGTLIFENRNIQPGDLQAGWDGSFKNKPVQPGVYVYLARIRFADESVRIKSGDITVLY